MRELVFEHACRIQTHEKSPEKGDFYVTVKKEILHTSNDVSDLNVKARSSEHTSTWIQHYLRKHAVSTFFSAYSMMSSVLSWSLCLHWRKC